MTKPLRAAIFGMGGFAGRHHHALRALETTGAARLVATCDPAPERFPELTADLQARGAGIYLDYRELLDARAGELDFATIATPIPLHAPMHRACVERSVAVYLEKPPTLDWRELDAMIETERNARFQTQVGFNFIVEDARQSLKSRLLSGEFGALRRAGFAGTWPRATKYYARAAWAGRLRVGESLILDSCAGNALAHYVHNLLFWCGQDALLSWGEVEWVEAELYRAHAIESFDTVFARGVSGGIPIWMGITHASSGPLGQREWLECERATLTYQVRGGKTEVRWADGRVEQSSAESGDLLTRNIAHYIAYLNGEQTRPLTTLADSRPFVILNDLLFVAAGHVTDVPESFVIRTTDARGDEWVAIADIGAAMEECAQTNALPSETGAPWGQSGGRARADEVTRLPAVIETMATAKRR